MPSLMREVFLTIAVLVPGLVWGTAQVPDVILIDGETQALSTNPLDSYLETFEWELPSEAVTSTANWRGYVATWEVSNEQLVVKDITIRVRDGSESLVRKSILGDIFPGTTTVVATWYSGALIVPDGELKRYVHMGYASKYDHYQVFRVSSGHVIERLSMTANEFEQHKVQKFQAFMETEDFRKAREELLEKMEDLMLTEEELLQFMREFYAEEYLSR